MVNNKLHIIMPVKDSLEMAERAIRAIVDSGHTLCVYDDNSLKDNAKRLDKLATETNIQVIHLSDLTDHPSPNYRLVLQLAQKQAFGDCRKRCNSTNRYAQPHVDRSARGSRDGGSRDCR